MSLWLPLNLRRSVSAERQSMEPTLSECQRPVKLFTLPEPTGSRSGRRLRNSGELPCGFSGHAAASTSWRTLRLTRSRAAVSANSCWRRSRKFRSISVTAATNSSQSGCPQSRATRAVATVSGATGCRIARRWPGVGRGHHADRGASPGFRGCGAWRSSVGLLRSARHRPDRPCRRGRRLECIKRPLEHPFRLLARPASGPGT
jgi:hypothetical protein